MKVGVDLTPLRASRPYRLLYVAGFVSMFGGTATFVTVPYQLKLLTGSPLEVGALGLAELVPIVVCGLYGGVLADRVDRRRLIIVSELVEMTAIIALFANALVPHPLVWVIFVADAFVVGAGSMAGPSVSALNQSYVGHDLQRAAAALGNLRGTTAQIAGPAFGGLIAVAVGPAAGYAVNLSTFVLSLALLVMIPRTGRAAAAGEHAPGVAGGLAYVRSRPDLVGTYVIDLLAMALAYPVLMFPFVAARFPEHYALSLLYIGLPVGALLATLTSAWSHRVHRYGRAVVYAAALWGLGVALMGEASGLALAFIGLVVAGGADAVSGIFRQTMWNESIPPEVRGRMAGVELISYSVGPTAGQFRAGAMAAATTTRVSLVFGGLSCTGAVGASALGLSRLWRFDARTDENVARVAAIRAGE